jgi:SpoIIAA-like
MNGAPGRSFDMTIGFHEILLEDAPVGKIVTLKFRETLRKKDYEEFVPRIEGLMQDGSKIRLVVELLDFQGWTVGALWEDTKFATKHFNDIGRLAVIGDTKWENAITIFIKPFTRAEVKYFALNEVDRARQWIREP